MYSYIRGVVKVLDENSIIIENNDIGYFINTSLNTVNFVQDNTVDTIYTYMYVREDNISLYGFNTTDERNMFILLIKISGVGPKAALGILSLGEISKLKYALINADSDYISGASGVGKKTASKIIIEIKDKISLPTGNVLKNDFAYIDSEKDMAIQALVALGFKYNEIKNTILKLDITDESDEEIIKIVLKNIGK